MLRKLLTNHLETVLLWIAYLLVQFTVWFRYA